MDRDLHSENSGPSDSSMATGSLGQHEVMFLFQAGDENIAQLVCSVWYKMRSLCGTVHWIGEENRFFVAGDFHAWTLPRSVLRVPFI